MIITNLFLIACILTFITDYSGFWNHVEQALAKWLKINKCKLPKLFTCSLCQTFWLTLIYICITNHFSIFNLTLCCLAAFSTKFILDVYYLLNDISITLVRFVQKLISKI